jgi:hypothetical protein
MDLNRIIAFSVMLRKIEHSIQFQAVYAILDIMTVILLMVVRPVINLVNLVMDLHLITV